ncbi:MAG: hypothetical protein P3B98_07555 [Gemmatimonadota bacterium]|nr:hypothetical protein [Gemmatimonadota bacterium]
MNDEKWVHAGRRALRLICALMVLWVASAHSLAGQPVGPSVGPVASLGEPLAVYLDCRASCDFNLIRTEITFVNWVRDREVANVHVLLTSQRAGAGGEHFTAAFLGDGALAGRGDTLTFTTNPTTTGDELRRGVTRMLALGLVQFVARTPNGQTLRVVPGETARAGDARPVPTRDPWNAWVFGVSLGGSTDGERSYKSQSLNTRWSANRVTEAWKTSFNYSYSYRGVTVAVQDLDSTGAVLSEETFRNRQRDWSGALSQVMSVTDHWSVGGDAEVASQTYRNQDLRMALRAAVEYNYFPYAEATRRELVFRYGAGVTSYRYADTTIFDQMRETLPSHFVQIEYRTREPWGSANVDMQHRNFLTDASKRTTEINVGFNVRLFRGFGINANGGYEWIRDQVYLPRGEQDAVDVLLRRRALLSGFQYQMRMGLSYTFGSIYNNVVNPRF